MIRVLAFFLGLLLAAASDGASPAVEGVDHIVIPVSRLDRGTAFYTGALASGDRRFRHQQGLCGRAARRRELGG
jgi:hypothetical protein